MLPGWRGSDAWLATVVLALAGVVVVAEVVGTIGRFDPVGLAAGSLLLAGLVVGFDRGRRRVGEEPCEGRADRPAAPRWHGLAAIAGLAPVVLAWTARTVNAIDGGTYSVDALWYHLPAAARFVETGRITSIQVFDDQPVTAYFPMTSSLLHGTGMAVFGSDLLSTVVNLGWLGLALWAAWRVGAGFGTGPAAAVGVAALLGGAGMVETQPGGALNDVAGVALLLAALAVALHGPLGRRQRGQDVVAGLALGLALGMKLTFLAPAALIAAGLLVATRRGERLRSLAVLAVAALPGLYWFARNAVHTSNPLPTLDASLGPIHLDAVLGTPATSSVSRYLFDGDAWTDHFLPGLDDAYGPLWWLLLGLVAAGIVAGALTSDGRVRLLAFATAGSLAAFVVTPQYLETGSNEPGFFPTNLRYAAPAIAMGGLLVAVTSRRLRSPALLVLVALALAAQWDAVSWPFVPRRPSFFAFFIDAGSAVAGTVVAVVAIALVAGTVAVLRGTARPAVAVCSALAGLVLVALSAVHPHYTDVRYRDAPYLRPLYRWAQDQRDLRIASVGPYGVLQYPLTGPDLSNHVQYLAFEAPDGGVRRLASCPELMRRLEPGRYDVVLAMNEETAAWMATQPDAVEIPEPVGDDLVEVEDAKAFRVDRTVTTRRC